jgi:tetratricopeptide (TPR) repeat protein
MNRDNPGRSRKWILGFATACLSLLACEGGVRLMEALLWKGPGNQIEASGTTPFVELQNVRPLFEVQHTGGAARYVRTAHHAFVSRNLQFPVEKTDTTFRVFCLGGSAAMGWPHDLSQSYPAFLQRELGVLYPNRKIEVINAAASTYSSFRVKVLFDEIVNYEPDLILVYSGNNEFLERILYRTDQALGSPWNRSAILRTIDRAATQWAKRAQVVDFDNYQPTFMIDIALGNTSPLKISPDQLAMVERHYRYNLSEMVRIARKRGIPIALLNVPVNLKDWIPHASVHRADIDRTAWQAWYRQAMEAYESGAYERAVAAFQQCVALDTLHAKSHYFYGRSLLALGQENAAAAAFLQAKETDAYPFRALQRFNEYLEKIAGESKVPLIDIVAVLQNQTTDGIPGEEVLVDHVHPTVASNYYIAKAVLDRLWVAGILPLPANRSDIIPFSPDDEGEKPLQVYQHLFLIYRVLLQYDKLVQLNMKLASMPESVRSGTHFLLLRDELERYLAVATPYFRLMRHQELGLAEGLYQPEEMQSIVTAYIQASRNSLANKMSDQMFEAFVPK